MKEAITRQLIVERIEALLEGKVSSRDFGEEMFNYFAFDENYEFEKGQESLIKEVLGKFTEMHDVDKKDCGYQPYMPSRDEFIELKQKLLK